MARKVAGVPYWEPGERAGHCQGAQGGPQLLLKIITM